MKYLMTLMVVLLIPTAALAKGECKEDKQKFCGGLEKKEVWGCLKKHVAELSGPCKAKLQAKAEEDDAKAEPKDSGPSTAPSTDTQPQPTYPEGQPQ